jgi:hypothetical protein
MITNAYKSLIAMESLLQKGAKQAGNLALVMENSE